MPKQEALEAIRKKLKGQKLSYQEIFSLMDEIAHDRLGPVLTTYFAAAGFEHGFSEDELYHLTRAMVETGDKLHFSGIVADKHSTGGVPGTRTTMILVPIIAAAGIKIPKNSSRAITAPSGTADTMEVLAPVTFSPRQIERIVNKINGCIVWGGHLGLAPADDVIIQVEKPLAFESFDKVVVSIMAKKIASGATHLVLDIPVGSTMKIAHFKDGEIIAKKFQFLARKFHINVVIDVNEIQEPAGRGVGPTLEVLDVLKVLEQRHDRSLTLERKAIRLAGKLLDLCFKDMKGKYPPGEEKAQALLVSGQALSKMREIIKEQGGNPDVSSVTIQLSNHLYEIKSDRRGRISGVNNQNIGIIARILGSPSDKKAGILLNKRLEESVDKNDILCTLFSSDPYRLKEAGYTLKNLPIYGIE